MIISVLIQLINELRLRLPLSERDEITSEAKRAAGLTEENYESKRALKVAQATVSSLQVCPSVCLNLKKYNNDNSNNNNDSQNDNDDGHDRAVSIEFRETNTKVITSTNHSRCKQRNE